MGYCLLLGHGVDALLYGRAAWAADWSAAEAHEKDSVKDEKQQQQQQQPQPQQEKKEEEGEEEEGAVLVEQEEIAVVAGGQVLPGATAAGKRTPAATPPSVAVAVPPCAWQRAAVPPPPARRLLVSALVCVLAAAQWQQATARNVEWGTPLLLWQSARRVNPVSAHAAHNVGLELSWASRQAEAVEAFRFSLRKVSPLIRPPVSTQLQPLRPLLPPLAGLLISWWHTACCRIARSMFTHMYTVLC